MNKPTILLCTAALALFASCKNHPPCGEGNPVDFIPRDSANKMISSYLNSINAPSNDSDLHAICIDMNQLRLYDQASAGANRISHLKIFFAHKLEYVNSGHGGQNAGYNSDALTLVLAGYTVNGNYVYLNGNQVLDHSSPCPHNCPPGQASGDLLQ